MIPDIALMVGAYIITRMVVVANDDDSSLIVKILCAMTILVTAYALVDIFMISDDFQTKIPQFP
ncbi:MAG: hypothetical protein PHH57_09225 [Candidatus Omnitrophica bacterium]|nr:hypothetical protein [Candidatus Omnitrophota bacterium]